MVVVGVYMGTSKYSVDFFCLFCAKFTCVSVCVFVSSSVECMFSLVIIWTY